MDSLTHMALGAALGEATLGRRLGGKAALWGAALATLPDLDVLIRHGDPVANFVYHRSFTHSLLILTLLAPLFALLVQRLHRLPAADWPRCLLFCWLVFCTHALLDALTVYGTHLFWPLADATVMWSTLFIIDPAFTLPLVVGLLITFRRTRQQGGWLQASPDRPVWPCLVGLLLSSGYVGWSIAASHQIETAVHAELDRQGIDATSVLTVPAPATTLLWRVVIMTDSHYLEGHRSVFDRSERMRLQAWPRHPELLEPLEQHWPVGKLRWFTHGFYAASLKDDAIVVTDLRMGQEPLYAFRFQVGALRRGTPVAVPARQLPMALDQTGLGWVWQRIWDEHLPPRADSTAR